MTSVARVNDLINRNWNQLGNYQTGCPRHQFNVLTTTSTTNRQVKKTKTIKATTESAVSVHEW